MSGFFVNSNPWGPEPTLLAGPSTYNAMGVGGTVSSPAPSSGNATLGYASLITSAISAIGDYQLAKTQAKATKSQLQFQRDMSLISSRMNERTAQSILDAGQKQVGRLTMRAGQVKSSQRAAMAANGISLDEGSAVEVQATTDLVKEIDANTIQANAIRSAWGYRTNSVNYSNEALMSDASAQSIKPQQSANSNLLAGAGGVARNWYSMRQAGVF
jgi:hypothetical protein